MIYGSLIREKINVKVYKNSKNETCLVLNSGDKLQILTLMCYTYNYKCPNGSMHKDGHQHCINVLDVDKIPEDLKFVSDQPHLVFDKNLCNKPICVLDFLALFTYLK